MGFLIIGLVKNIPRRAIFMCWRRDPQPISTRSQPAWHSTAGRTTYETNFIIGYRRTIVACGAHSGALAP